MDQKSRVFKISYKITIMVVLMVTVCAAATGIFTWQRIERELYHQKGMTSQIAAATFVSGLDVKALQTIIETGEQDEYYEYLCHAMQLACGKVDGMAYINMVTMAGEGFEVIYAQTADGEHAWSLGYIEPFDAWSQAAFDAYEYGINTYSEPYYAPGYSGLISG